MSDDLFPEVVRVIRTPPCQTPYFVAAYWPKGGWWSIGKRLYETPYCPALTQEIERMQRSGWVGIMVLKLPEGIEK